MGNDFLQGGAGDDYLDGGAGFDFVSYASGSAVTVNLGGGGAAGGTAGSDTISGVEAVLGSGYNDWLVGDAGGNYMDGLSGDDTLVGGAGNDALLGGTGTDSLEGGAGNDALIGGAGADSFKWSLSDAGSAGTPAVDTLSDFDNVASSDKLDLKDLLQGEHSNAASLDGFLDFHLGGGNTTIDVRPAGAATDMTQQIVLSGVDLTAGGTLTDSQIITNLLNNGQLITDV